MERDPQHSTPSTVRRVEWRRPWLPVRLARRLLSELRVARMRAVGAQIAPGVRVEQWSSLSLAGGLSVGTGSILKRGLRLEVHAGATFRGSVRIGDRCHLGPSNHIGAADSIDIGHEVLTAEGVTILDHDHDFSDPEDPDRRNRCVVTSAVRIEDRVFLGERVVVLKGVTIGRCAVVGAHAVVTGDLPPYSMSVGAPARPIAFWDKELRAWRKA